MSYKIIFRTLHLTLVFFALTFAVSAEIKYKEVTSTGIGQSYEEALNNAFAEAISMVNGKNIQTRTIIQVLGGESIPKNNADTNTILNKILKAIKSEDKNDENVDNKREKEESEKNEPKYSQNYIKNLIDETKGGIKSYEVIDKDINEKGWHEVKVLASVAVFDLPQEAKRTRIAIIPFRLYDVI